MEKNGECGMAAQGGHGDMVKDLLRAGADLNKANKYGSTPLSQAAMGGHGANARVQEAGCRALRKF